MKRVLKAVIPAAGMGTRFLPITKAIPKEMLPIIDKPAIHYVVQEAIDAGIQEILIIINERKSAIRNYFSKDIYLEEFLETKSEFLEKIKPISDSVKIFFLNQNKPNGLGSAIRYAKEFVNNEPFVVLLPDDIIENEEINATRQCINAFDKYQSTIIGVQEVLKCDISKYGIVKYFNQDKNLIEIESIIEKPSLENAPSNIAAIGRYVLMPNIFSAIDNTLPDAVHGEIGLTSSMKIILEDAKIYGVLINGKRYDTGQKLGYLNCVMDFFSKENLNNK